MCAVYFCCCVGFLCANVVLLLLLQFTSLFSIRSLWIPFCTLMLSSVLTQMMILIHAIAVCLCVFYLLSFFFCLFRCETFSQMRHVTYIVYRTFIRKMLWFCCVANAVASECTPSYRHVVQYARSRTHTHLHKQPIYLSWQRREVASNSRKKRARKRKKRNYTSAK